MIRTLFGFPMYMGLKRRIAKKYFNRYWMRLRDKDARQRYRAHLRQFENMKVGDSVNTCTGLNGRITEIEPMYIAVANGQLLISIDLSTTVGGCSFTHCGITLPKTKAEMETEISYYLRHPKAVEYNWDIRYSPEVTTIHDDGSVSINWERERQLIEAREAQQGEV